MGSTKHEKTFVDYDKTYEQNIIGLKGIVYFAVGLVILVVITFGLMYLLINVMEDNARETKESQTPMMLKGDDRLPPEPRLQGAPGFGIDGPNGRIDLGLRAPQSEWWELKKQWETELANGQKDAKTGTVVTMPIEEAKRKLMEQNVKARPAEQGQKALDDARTYVSYPSGGRLKVDRRR